MLEIQFSFCFVNFSKIKSLRRKSYWIDRFFCLLIPQKGNQISSEKMKKHFVSLFLCSLMLGYVYIMTWRIQEEIVAKTFLFVKMANNQINFEFHKSQMKRMKNHSTTLISINSFINFRISQAFIFGRNQFELIKLQINK